MKKQSDPHSSEITPEHLYLNRRYFVKAGVLAATSVATGWIYRQLNSPSNKTVQTEKLDVLENSGLAA